MPQNLFPYPGNKARHAEWIIQHIPEHTCYVEPFGGAAGVLFNKPQSKVEVYNDLDGDIVHFFEVLRDRPDELKQFLKHTPFSRELHERYLETYRSGGRPDDPIEYAASVFYLRYSGFGGAKDLTNGFRVERRASAASKFRYKIRKLDQFAERLSGVVIESGAWREVVNSYDGPRTLFYMDPPYEGTEFRYGDGEFDHRSLYRTVTSVDGMCILSYDTIPHWYGDDFQVVSKESTHSGINSNQTGDKDCTEYLIMNFDADGEPLMSDVGQQGLDAFGD